MKPYEVTYDIQYDDKKTRIEGTMADNAGSEEEKNPMGLQFVLECYHSRSNDLAHWANVYEEMCKILQDEIARIRNINRVR